MGAAQNTVPHRGTTETLINENENAWKSMFSPLASYVVCCFSLICNLLYVTK